MITINNKSICEKCFKEIDAEPCRYCGYSKASYRQDPITLKIGSVLNQRYIIGGVIGKGGFGITYASYDLKLDTRIAVKEYYPMGMAIRNPGSTKLSVTNQDAEEPFKNGAEKFYNEAKTVARFNGNPNIVSVHDFFYENDTVYFTMDYLQGQTLKSYLKEKGRLSEGRAVKLLQDVSNALMVTHSMNILHRDISPDNIMLCDDGSIKLLDFGAARQVTAEQSKSLSVILKQGFAPLEQYQKRGKQGPWTDIYALGATVYNALTGDTLDDPMTRFEDDAEFESNKYAISDSLWQIIYKAVMLKIEDRYQDVFELKKDINSLDIKPDQIVEQNASLEETFTGQMAKAFESQDNDPNATSLLSDSDIYGSSENQTVAIRQFEKYPKGIEPEKIPGNGTQNSSFPKEHKSFLFLVPVTAVAVLAVIVLLVVLIGNTASSKDSSDFSDEDVEMIDEAADDDSESKSEIEEVGGTEEIVDSKGTEKAKTLFANDVEEDDDENDEEEDAPANEVTEEVVRNDDNDNEEFGLNGDEASSYEITTYVSEYDYFDSHTGLFKFAYPRSLYSSVSREPGEINGRYEDTVTFRRSDGSRLIYHMQEFQDPGAYTLENRTAHIYSSYMDSIVELQDIYPVKIDASKGFFIITGRERDDYGSLAYIMVNVNRDCVYEMEVYFPDYESGADKDWKGYYAECLYRSCGFTNSSKSVRTFEEYMDAQ